MPKHPTADEPIDIEKLSEESDRRRDLIVENANAARDDLIVEVELLGHQVRAISRINHRHDCVELDDARHFAIKALLARVAEVDGYAKELAEEYERACADLAEEDRQRSEKGSKWMAQLMAKQGARKKARKKKGGSEE